MDTKINIPSYYNRISKIIFKILLIIVFGYFVYFVFMLLDEYRLSSAINKNDKSKFGKIDLYLYEFYSLCNRYPTTEEKLSLLSNDLWCGKPGNKLKEDLLTMEDSQLIYISDGKKYRLILYRNIYGIERGR